MVFESFSVYFIKLCATVRGGEFCPFLYYVLINRKVYFVSRCFTIWLMVSKTFYRKLPVKFIRYVNMQWRLSTAVHSIIAELLHFQRHGRNVLLQSEIRLIFIASYYFISSRVLYSDVTHTCTHYLFIRKCTLQ